MFISFSYLYPWNAFPPFFTHPQCNTPFDFAFWNINELFITKKNILFLNCAYWNQVIGIFASEFFLWHFFHQLYRLLVLFIEYYAFSAVWSLTLVVISIRILDSSLSEYSRISPSLTLGSWYLHDCSGPMKYKQKCQKYIFLFVCDSPHNSLPCLSDHGEGAELSCYLDDSCPGSRICWSFGQI